MASISDQLKENPAAKELLANQKAIRQLLADPETRKVLSSLQKKNSAQLQAAAQSALQGNSAALSGLLQELSLGPSGRSGHAEAGQKSARNLTFPLISPERRLPHGQLGRQLKPAFVRPERHGADLLPGRETWDE
ncbi:MAG: hypothetical protein ACLUNZ_13380 [Evtepia sp.]